MTSLADIGLRLVDARKRLGITQRELAERLGVKQQQVARWESERYGCISLARLSRVADVLGFTLDGPAVLAAEAPAAYGQLMVASQELTPVRDLGEIVARVRAYAPELHDRFGITRVAVFGSFARGEQTPQSDVDLIVEVERPTLENVLGSERALSGLLGRRTEAGSLEAINPRVRATVIEDMVDVWKA